MNLLRENLERHMREFCLNIGDRHVGSSGESAAADYIENEFRAYGLDVIREFYPVTGWNFRRFKFENQSDNRPVPASCCCFFSNGVECEGEILWLTPHELKHLGSIRIAGRICMVECYVSEQNLLSLNAIAEQLDALGARAAVFISPSDLHTARAPSSKAQRSPFLKHMAACIVSEEGALYLASRKKDRYRLEIDASVFPHRSCNIVAHLGSGSGKGVFGAHYDTAPFTQGAGDNAAGTAMLLETARFAASAGIGCPLDFVAFSAEEYVTEKFPPGSKNYMDLHRHENLQWYVNFDAFGRFTGEPLLMMERSEVFRDLRSMFCLFETLPPGDCKIFSESGIPSFSYSDRDRFKLFHTALDTLDTMDVDRLASGVDDALNLSRQLAAHEKPVQEKSYDH